MIAGKKFRITLLLLLAAWLVFAQSCMYFRISDSQAKNEFDAKGVPLQIHYDTIGETTLHYVQTGNDSLPTLFFIHGSPGSWDAFKQYLKDSDLLRRFRMISVDRPGFGYSDFGHALNLDEQSNLLSMLLKNASNQKSVYLVGHSLGGPLCFRLAIDHPKAIAGIVLLAGAIDPAQEKPEKWRLLFMHTPLQFLVPGAMRPSNYELWYLKKDLVKLQRDIDKTTLPYTWMLHGNKDMLVPYKNVDFARKHIDSSRLSVITIEGANHFIPWSHYAIIKKQLLSLP